jgi:hypothetical protein
LLPFAVCARYEFHYPLTVYLSAGCLFAVEPAAFSGTTPTKNG